MSNQMSWLSNSDDEGQLILHLREHSLQPWLPYTACPQHQVPDDVIPNGSSGWSTYRKLRQEGWSLIPAA